MTAFCKKQTNKQANKQTNKQKPTIKKLRAGIRGP